MIISTIALPVICLIWAGMLLGVSFIATPVKFSAKSLDLPTAIDVGRVTFGLFSKIEWGMAVIVTLLCAFTMPGVTIVELSAIVVLAVAFEAIVLLPRLDVRAAKVVAGETLAPSWLHKAYVWFEITKLLGLIALAILALGRAT